LSKIALSGNASGTGTLTIAAPNTNTDRTLTLPDNTGTILTNATTAGFPAGSVLQVVQNTTSTGTSSASSTYADTALSASITPTSNTSKILIIVYQGQCNKTANDTQLNIRIVRGAGTAVLTSSALNQGAATGLSTNITMTYLDSPATTSSTTYKTQLANRDNAGTVEVNFNGTATMILMEIAA